MSAYPFAAMSLPLRVALASAGALVVFTTALGAPDGGKRPLCESRSIAMSSEPKPAMISVAIYSRRQGPGEEFVQIAERDGRCWSGPLIRACAVRSSTPKS